MYIYIYIHTYIYIYAYSCRFLTNLNAIGSILWQSKLCDWEAQCILGNHELNILRGEHKHGNHWFFGETEVIRKDTEDVIKNELGMGLFVVTSEPVNPFEETTQTWLKHDADLWRTRRQQVFKFLLTKTSKGRRVGKRAKTVVLWNCEVLQTSKRVEQPTQPGGARGADSQYRKVTRCEMKIETLWTVGHSKRISNRGEQIIPSFTTPHTVPTVQTPRSKNSS